MPVEKAPVVEKEKNPVVEGKVKKRITKEMILQRISEVSLIGSLVSGFDPVNIEGNYQSRSSLRVFVYFGKVSKTCQFICYQTGKGGDVFALWGYCHRLDYSTQLDDILEHINRRF
ncbi:hypothetical protein [Cardinium endosymbiont of Oedothorax gibbosus]|uniref:hypothetical protein n=1 Tax=Cardinium endosymbiont of Oedothorax gibbosus TaxID=931101 RepID=UPI002023D669|nr:hypothetical protein [Cardinium endosymbiont of Oedothorax gibbosus]